MSGDTLILNSDGNPLSIIPLSVISWQEAIKLLYQEKVVPIENYEYWTVHSERLAMQVPAIVMTKKFYSKFNRVRFTKQNLYYRDEGKCQYCGEEFMMKDLTQDHVLPKSSGGRRTWDNVCLSCGPCNWSRGNDYSIKPISRPKKPSYFELIKKRKKFPINISHSSWEAYLGWPENLVNFGNVREEGSFDLETLKDLKK